MLKLKLNCKVNVIVAFIILVHEEFKKNIKKIKKMKLSLKMCKTNI
jgi:hypothetical protein